LNGDKSMLYIDPTKVKDLAPTHELIDSIESALREEYVIPLRQVVELPDRDHGGLFVSMPCFDSTGMGVVKLATVLSDNPKVGLPAVQAVVVVFSGNGTAVAAIDGVMLTYLRTGAVSALASKYLSRRSSSHLVVIGTGGLAPALAASHCSVRPITHVTVCGRSQERVEQTAAAIQKLVGRPLEITAGGDVEAAVRAADIVTCATSSAEPVLRGKWVKDGAHIDLVGSFSPAKRESDDDVVRRARIYVDNMTGALAEAGDIVDPLGRGVITRERIEGDLSDLARGGVLGRQNGAEITLFKSVGSAVQDLAAARLIMARLAPDCYGDNVDMKVLA